MKRVARIITTCGVSILLGGCALSNNPQTMLALGKELGAAQADTKIMAAELRGGLSNYWATEAAAAQSEIESIRQQRGRQAESLGILTWDRSESINRAAKEAEGRVERAVTNNMRWLEGTLKGADSAIRALNTIEAVFDANNQAEADIRSHAASELARLSAAAAALKTISSTDETEDDEDQIDEEETKE